MAKATFFALALVLFGAIAGNQIAHYTDARHQPARAVMLLAQFHFGRLSAAAKSGQCSSLPEERGHLMAVYGEIPGAFSKLYPQDAQFRKRADGLRDALHTDTLAAGDCSSLDGVKKIEDACEGCHRDYR
jgi:hypothetical protein